MSETVEKYVAKRLRPRRSSEHAKAVEAARKLVAALGGVANVSHQGPGPRRRDGSQCLCGTAGIPDLWIQLPPGARCDLATEAFWFEVKVGRDWLGPAQKAFITRSEACGGPAVLAGSTDDLCLLLGVDPHLGMRAIDRVRRLEEAGKLFAAKAIEFGLAFQ